jgi:hypothetical protein
MADYSAAGRSNYFKVKDRAAFEQELEQAFPDLLNVQEGPQGDAEKEGRLMLYTDEFAGAWPTDFGDDDMGDGRRPWDVVAPHLVDGEVAVFFESGHTKRAYVGGYAVAVNNKGDQERVDLRDIYARARELGDVVTETLY